MIEHMNKVTQYLTAHLPERENWMIVLEQYAKKHQIPIMEPVSMNVLTQLVRMYKPKSILEIGSAIGYSALRMHATNPTAKIVTIEKNQNMVQLARQNIKLRRKENHIQVLFGDAIDQIEMLVNNKAKFDFVFIDAAKGQYKRFFQAVQPLLSKDSVIVCDNVLFKGYVANNNRTNHLRYEKLSEKIRAFNTWLMKQEAFHSSIVPIGDGISISIKMK